VRTSEIPVIVFGGRGGATGGWATDEFTIFVLIEIFLGGAEFEFEF
jgi:hypothetical protein